MVDVESCLLHRLFAFRMLRRLKPDEAKSSKALQNIAMRVLYGRAEKGFGARGSRRALALVSQHPPHSSRRFPAQPHRFA